MKKKKKDQEELKEKGDIKDKISKMLELPEEIMLDIPKLQFIGNKDLYIENYKGIIEYSNQMIRINTNSHLVKIIGKKLEIKTITAEEIMISGCITSLEFIA